MQLQDEKQDALTRLTQAKETLNDINQAQTNQNVIQHLLMEFKIFKIHKWMLGKNKSQNYD